MIYSIPRWSELYENSRSRKVKDLQWVPVRNSHDGEGYMRVMSHPMAAQIFSAWILILEVASKCSRRGFLVRDNGKPHTPESLAMKTRTDAEWFRLAFEVLSDAEIGWLSVVSALPCEEEDCSVHESSHHAAEEEKGKERIEEKEGIESADLASALVDHLSEIPSCKDYFMVGDERPKAIRHMQEFLDEHSGHPPDWWLSWAKDLKVRLPNCQVHKYGARARYATEPVSVLRWEWKHRPPDGVSSSLASGPDTDWLPMGNNVYRHVSTGELARF